MNSTILHLLSLFLLLMRDNLRNSFVKLKYPFHGFRSNKNSLPTCLLPSVPNTAKLPILSQKTVDINMTLRCPLIFQKYFVFWLGAQQGQQSVIYHIGEMSLC